MYTRWPEALPLSEITTETIPKAFVSVRVARFGLSPANYNRPGKAI